MAFVKCSWRGMQWWTLSVFLIWKVSWLWSSCSCVVKVFLIWIPIHMVSGYHDYTYIFWNCLQWFFISRKVRNERLRNESSDTCIKAHFNYIWILFIVFVWAGSAFGVLYMPFHVAYALWVIAFVIYIMLDNGFVNELIYNFWMTLIILSIRETQKLVARKALPPYNKSCYFIKLIHHNWMVFLHACFFEQGASVEIRQAAGLLLKNNLRSALKSLDPAYQQYIKSQLLPCLGEAEKDIRNTVGTIISVIVQQGRILGWPELLQALVQCLDSNDINHMEGALDTLSKVWCTSLIS